jgi:hypothetical protein
LCLTGDASVSNLDISSTSSASKQILSKVQNEWDTHFCAMKYGNELCSVVINLSAFFQLVIGVQNVYVCRLLSMNLYEGIMKKNVVEM